MSGITSIVDTKLCSSRSRRVRGACGLIVLSMLLDACGSNLCWRGIRSPRFPVVRISGRSGSVADSCARFAADRPTELRDLRSRARPPRSDHWSPGLGVPVPGELGRREPRAASATRAAADRPATAPAAARPCLLGPPFARVVSLVRHSCDRQTSDRHCLASSRLCAVLGVQVPACGPPAARRRDHRTHREDGIREPDLEPAPYRSGARDARPRGQQGLGGEIHAEARGTSQATAIRDVGNLRANAPGRHARDRFPHRANGDVPHALRLRSAVLGEAPAEMAKRIVRQSGRLSRGPLGAPVHV
jgi:hypothetical protein